MKLEEYLDDELKECCNVEDAVDLFLACDVKLRNRDEKHLRVHYGLEDGVVLKADETLTCVGGEGRLYGVAHYNGLTLLGAVLLDAEYEKK
ncbi:hypothetical protein GOV10_02990 [Candidatus Woesearchaeota archaeon]|nr:hypothetical protein [Candidatus Woesearchaeota archaeon]